MDKMLAKGVIVPLEPVAIPIPKGKRKVPEAVTLAANLYRREYRRVYGIAPEILWDGVWFHLTGTTYRVKLIRLKQMTAQLKYRGS